MIYDDVVRMFNKPSHEVLADIQRDRMAINLRERLQQEREVQRAEEAAQQQR